MQKSPTDPVSTLQQKMTDRSLAISILGLGYVGLPMAISFARAGFKVYGIDPIESKTVALNRGETYIKDIPASEIQSAIKTGNLTATTDFSAIKKSDVVLICVPTPIKNGQEPDLDAIHQSVTAIRNNFRPGCLIILESTTYPGTTEEILKKEFDSLGYKVGVDYFLCFSPERIDPGNTKFSLENTPKVVGGMTETCTAIGTKLYETICERVVPVSSPSVAEMSKLLENTFRSINIAFINEMAMMCEELHIDIWEVIRAASTKPFGFMPFQPGPGIGGHCIPLDPLYLSWKARRHNFFGRFIELANETNRKMPMHVVNRAAESLSSAGKPLSNARILILGMTYKAEIDDLRESPGLEIFELLEKRGAHVEFHDFYATSFIDTLGDKKNSIPSLSPDVLAKIDLAIVVTAHKKYDFKEIARYCPLILDCRNAVEGPLSARLHRLGSK